MRHTKLDKVSESLTRYFRKNRLFATAYSTYDGDGIEIEINWGDWKHEHLRCNYLIYRFFGKLGISVKIEEETIEEDGSDCYSAIHRIYIG